MKRASSFPLLFAGILGLTILATAWAQPKPTSPAVTAIPPVISGAGQQVNVTLHILTGELNGHPGWPMFSPSEIVLPAHALVTMTIVDYDDGPAPVAAPSDLQVKGVVGNEILVTPNESKGAVVKAGAYHALSAEQTAHTLTIPSLGLNVPVPVSGTVTFMFRTAAPGIYEWQCETACGTSPNGWGGAMTTYGYMKGRLLVQ